MFFIAFFLAPFLMDHLFRSRSAYSHHHHFDPDAPRIRPQAIMFSILYAILCLVVAFAIGTTDMQGIVAFLLASAFCVPFFFWDVRVRDMILPGVCVGAGLALLVGSTRGRRIVLFAVPTCCNYIIVLALYHPV